MNTVADYSGTGFLHFPLAAFAADDHRRFLGLLLRQCIAHLRLFIVSFATHVNCFAGTHTLYQTAPDPCGACIGAKSCAVGLGEADGQNPVFTPQEGPCLLGVPPLAHKRQLTFGEWWRDDDNRGFPCPQLVFDILPQVAAPLSRPSMYER